MRGEIELVAHLSPLSRHWGRKGQPVKEIVSLADGWQKGGDLSWFVH